jgi:hypothetical protein
VNSETSGEPGAGAVTFHMGSRTVVLMPVEKPVSYAPLREMGFVGRVLSAIVGDPLFTSVAVEWREAGVTRRGRLELTTFR